MSKLNVALIGHGHLGKWHAQKVYESPQVKLAAIVEPCLETQKVIATQYPDTRVCSHLNETIDSIDAAIVATPTSLHFPLVKELLLNDKHVFCEKPLTDSLKDSLELKKILLTKPNLILQVGHSERVHEVWESVDRYPQFFHEENKAIVHFKRVAPYKGRATDVDVIQDLMIHDIDLAFHLFKQKPKLIRAFGEKIRTNKFDYVWAEVIFNEGLRSTFIASRNDVSEQRSMEIINKNGTFMVDLLKNEYKFACAREKDKDLFVTSNSYTKRDHLLFEQERFYASILTGEKTFVSIDDALSVVKVMDAIKECILTHQEMIIK